MPTPGQRDWLIVSNPTRIRAVDDFDFFTKEKIIKGREISGSVDPAARTAILKSIESEVIN